MGKRRRGNVKPFNPDKLLKELQKDAEKRGATANYDFGKAREQLAERMPRPEAGTHDPDKLRRGFALQTIATRETMDIKTCERLEAANFDEATRMLMAREEQSFPEAPEVSLHDYELYYPKFVILGERHNRRVEQIQVHNRELQAGVDLAFDILNQCKF